jgi:hypothetical protein
MEGTLPGTIAQCNLGGDDLQGLKLEILLPRKYSTIHYWLQQTSAR